MSLLNSSNSISRPVPNRRFVGIAFGMPSSMYLMDGPMLARLTPKEGVTPMPPASIWGTL